MTEEDHMRNTLLAGCFVVLAVSGLAFFAAGPANDELKKKPVATAKDELGDLLRAWQKEGTASGNVGDWYDNRDRNHSGMDLSLYPQLRRVQYTAEEVKAERNWAFQPRVLPHVVVGNSSTAAPPNEEGSNVRSAYCEPSGLDVLSKQYLKNNLYIYPEHLDHDPGHNGVGGGYGDLFPTNTPYLLTSQGSSYTDQPFLKAVVLTLAAFRPEVKKKLVETGLLMPTVQMILRSTNRHLKRPEEYFTGQAHPTAFDGSWVDPLKMAKLAHDIRLDTIPPLVKLRVLEEEKQVNGRDFFERDKVSEQHSDTVSVVSRVWRGAAKTRKLVVSAEDSLDLSKKPLTFRWVVLRGDEGRIKIKERDKDRRVVEITVDYHGRRPIAPGSALESNRVDIGVFADNQTYPSAPAFVTFFTLDNEARRYDDKGHVTEIAYGMGLTEMKVTDDARLMGLLAKDELPAKILGLTAAQRDVLGKVALASAPLVKDLEAARAKHDRLEAKRKTIADRMRGKEQQADVKKAMEAATKDANDARGAVTKAEQSLNRILDQNQLALGAGGRAFLKQVVEKAMRTPDLWWKHREAFEKQREAASGAQRARLDAAIKKVSQLGIVAAKQSSRLDLLERESAFARAMLDEFHARALAELVLPDTIAPVFHANFVDHRLTAPKAWRDVYQYDGDRLTGWKRFAVGNPDGVAEFTPEGWLVVEKDAKGKPTKARAVSYFQAPAKPDSVNTNPLEQRPVGAVITLKK
jgi:hypothetical protein